MTLSRRDLLPDASCHSDASVTLTSMQLVHWAIATHIQHSFLNPSRL